MNRAAREEGEIGEDPEMAAKWVNFAFSSFTYYPNATCHMPPACTNYNTEQCEASAIQGPCEHIRAGSGLQGEGQAAWLLFPPDLPDSRVNWLLRWWTWGSICLAESGASWGTSQLDAGGTERSEVSTRMAQFTSKSSILVVGVRLSHQYTSVRLAVFWGKQKPTGNKPGHLERTHSTRWPEPGSKRTKGQAQKYLPHGREGETEGMSEMPWGAPTTQKKISEGTIVGDTLPEEEREGVRKRLRRTWWGEQEIPKPGEEPAVSGAWRGWQPGICSHGHIPSQLPPSGIADSTKWHGFPRPQADASPEAGHWGREGLAAEQR